MAQKKTQNKKNLPQNRFRIDEDVLKIETEEINYNLDSDPDLENDSDLIKFEFNMIELPFFTKDKKVEEGKARKYIFSERDKSYMRVVPSGDPELISNKIPQEFDEKIFYGILKLSKEQRSKEIVTDYFTLSKAADVHYNDLHRIKDSHERLSNCKIEMHNLFYDAGLRSKMDGKEEFSVLQSKVEYTFKKMQELSEEKRDKYKKFFRNSKISEIIILTLSDKVYKNIERKGFLYFDSKNLLEIDNATARKLFMLITKWHGWEKKPVIKRSCRFLASRIPLSWEKNSIRSSVNYLENACSMLQKKKLINSFSLTRTKPVENSYIEFHFSGENSKLIDYNLQAASITTGHENIVIDGIEDEFLDDKQMNIFDALPERDLDSLISRLPENMRTESNINLLKQYSGSGVEYIVSAIEYTKKHCKENFDAYLAKCLADDWAKGEREKQVVEERKKNEQIRKEADKTAKQKKTAEKFYSSMSGDDLEKIHREAEASMYYKFTFKDKVDRGEIDKKEALKEVSLVLISGKIEKDR
jgi:hypothetical protein